MTAEERLHALCLEHVLGTLEGEELAELEALLSANDPQARAAMEEANETVAALALAAPPAEPSPSVRNGLMAQVSPAQKVVEMSAPKSSRGPSALAWAAAAAAGVCAVLFWQQLRTTRDALRDLQARFDDFSSRQEQVTAENIRYRRIEEILASPDTFTIQMDAQNQARIQAYWNDRQGLVVAGRNIPQPEQGRELQLWVVPREAAPESVEIFRPDANGNALIVAEPRTAIAEANALAITDEPAGGSPAPTTTPIWAGAP